jgi:hypothetical protein
MIIKDISFKNFKENFFDENNSEILINNKFGEKYIIFKNIVIKINNDLSKSYCVKKNNINKVKEKNNVIKINQKDNEFGIVLNRINLPNQIFHILFCNLYIINTILSKVDHLNIYINKDFYDKCIFENDSIVEKTNTFKSYLKLLGLLDRVSFKILDEGYYEGNNFICVYSNSDVSEGFSFSYEDVKLLKEQYLKVENKKNYNYNKIYLNRKSFHSRTVDDENILSDYFESLGFKSIALEDYSLKDQIDILSKADVIVGISGSSFTNLVFVDKKLVVELTYTPNKKQYYEYEECGNDEIFEVKNLRYSFNWSSLLNIFDHDVFKIELSKIDNGQEAVDMLKKDQYFINLINMI